MKWIDKDDIIDAFFPPACPICSRPRPFENGERLWLHKTCEKQLRYIKEPRCMKCGKHLDTASREFCYDCGRIKHSYNQAVAVYEYTDSIKKSIYRFKYKNKREYAAFFAKEMYEGYRDVLNAWGIDVIMSVPLHRSRYKRRGFNQAELIARELGRLSGISVDTTSLVRIKKTRPMKELDNEGRSKNLKNAFNLTTNSVVYKKILIVDDIYTTGATLDACSDLLKSCGAREVYGICLCIGNGF